VACASISVDFDMCQSSMEDTSPPSLLVTVSGTVMHGSSASVTQPSSRSLDDQLRLFAQAFMLAPDTDAAPGAQVKYYVLSDDMRFVG
jgi:NTF2-related export protein 1/2